MIVHYHLKKLKKVFVPILASTLDLLLYLSEKYINSDRWVIRCWFNGPQAISFVSFHPCVKVKEVFFSVLRKTIWCLNLLDFLAFRLKMEFENS